jgi:hypothetical protein
MAAWRSRIGIHTAEKLQGEVGEANFLTGSRRRTAIVVLPKPKPAESRDQIAKRAAKKRKAEQLRRESAPRVPEAAYQHKIGWVGRVMKFDRGPNGDGLGEGTTVEMKFEAWPGSKKVWETPILQFFERTEDGVWRFPDDDRTRAAGIRALEKYQSVLLENVSPFPPLKMLPGDHNMRTWVKWHAPTAYNVCMFMLHTQWLAWVHQFQTLFAQAVHRQFVDRDSANQRKVVVCEGFPLEAFMVLFVIGDDAPETTVHGFATPPAVYGPHDVVNCSLSCPPDRCDPRAAIHADCTRDRGYTVKRLFYAEELCSFMTSDSNMLSSVWPAKKYWVNSTDTGMLRMQDPVVFKYSTCQGKLTVQCSYDQMDADGNLMP